MNSHSRLAWLLAASVILLGVAAVPASADVPRNSWGFTIADDQGNFDNPTSLPAFGDSFARLRPRVFRLQIIWNAKEGVPSNPTQADIDRANARAKWIPRTHAMIDRARAQGAQQIIVTLRANHWGNYGRDMFFPTPGRYEIEARKIVQEFASKVDVWGPANEPCCSWRPDNEDTPGIDERALLNSTTLAGFYESMKEVVDIWDPTALLTSPDFLDVGNYVGYINNYKAAGGGWGDVAAWHPYTAVNQGTPTLATTNNFAATVPAGREIWVTEVGAHLDVGTSVQRQRVAWIVDPVNGLASHDRVTRIGYYHMLDHNAEWDTALLNEDLSPRPAWYAWCAAAHGDDPNHLDCLGDLPVTGDWDGDGTDTVGVFRRSSGTWYLIDTTGPEAHHVFNFGLPRDIPVVGDWNGDGTDTAGVFRPPVPPSTVATWYLTNTTGPEAHAVFDYGWNGDWPMGGDWNSDGVDSVGVFRSSNVRWYLTDATGPVVDYLFDYGLGNDLALVGDWNGDGRDTPGVFRPPAPPSTVSTWYLTNTNGPQVHSMFDYGLRGDRPVSGDWNGDGTETAGVFRPSTATWYLTNTTGPQVHHMFQFGLPNN